MKGEVPDVSLPLLEASSGELSIVMFTLGFNRPKLINSYLVNAKRRRDNNLIDYSRT